MKSVFTDKAVTPADADLKKALGSAFDYWQQLQHFTKHQYPDATEAWNYSGEKYGWSFRISDKKRVLLYLLPRDKYFKVAFVFGQKATDAILKSKIAESIKKELSESKVYAEGRGIRIDVQNGDNIADIKNLIAIKISS